MATLLVPVIDERRFERINGELRERPVPNTLHMQVQRRIYKLLDQLLEETEAEVGPEWSITRPGHADQDDPDYMTADVLVCYPPFITGKNGHLTVPGFLAVEVVSPGQGADLIDKAIRYAAWGKPHVWIVNPDTRVCLEFHGGDTFMIQREELHADAPVTLRVADIFSKLSKAEKSQ